MDRERYTKRNTSLGRELLTGRGCLLRLETASGCHSRWLCRWELSSSLSSSSFLVEVAVPRIRPTRLLALDVRLQGGEVVGQALLLRLVE